MASLAVATIVYRFPGFLMWVNRAGAALAAWCVLGASVLWSGAAQAQCVSLTTLGSASTQSFDTLSNTAGSTTNNLTITGWFLTESGGGARDNEQYGVDTGGSNTGDTYSYGAAAATDRALGGLRSGTLIPLVGACFTNNTGSSISSLAVAYTGEEWRLGTAARTDQISFEYSTNATDLVTGTWTGVAALNFVTPDTAITGAKNGNAAASRTALSSTISALSIANGATFWIRWTDTDASGADDGLAVDDFSLTPNAVVGTPYTLTSNSPQTVNAVVGASASVTVTATVANPTAGTSYDVQVQSAAAFPPLSLPSPAAYPGVAPGSYAFARTCTPAARGIYTASQTIQATQVGGPIAGTNPQTVVANWICQTPSDLTLTVSDGGASGNVGGTIAYTFGYANVSAQSTAGVVISTTVPANTTFNAGASSAGWSCANGAPGGSSCTLTVGALAAVTNGSRTFAVTILPAAAGGTLAISGSVSDDGVGGSDLVPADNTGNDTTPVGAGADLLLTLTDTPDPVNAGSNLSYAAVATNLGPSAATDVSIAVPVPGGTTFVAASASAGASCTQPAVGATGTVNCTWNGNTAVGAGNARSVNVQVAVPASTLAGASLGTTASVSATSTDPVSGNNSAGVATTVSVAADLTSTLTDTPDPVNAGTNLSYLATLINNGPSDAQDASLTLPTPATTTFVSAAASAGGLCTTPAVGASGNIVCTWAGATAPGVGNARSMTVVVGVPANTANGSIFVATATTGSTSTDPSALNNTATVTTGILTSADLSLTLTDAPDPVYAGAALTYVATLSNAGPADAQDAAITLPLPAGTSLGTASASVGGNCVAGASVVCTWTGATVQGATRTATIVVNVALAQTTAINASAAASSPTADPNSSNNTVSVTTAVVSTDLSITLSDAPDPVAAGANLSYTATVSNAGPSDDATGVTVSLPLPAGTSLVSGTVSGGGSCAGSPVVCSFAGNLLVGVARTATIVVAVAPATPNATVLNATATVSSATPDPNTANNNASTSTTVSTNADLQLTLNASATQVPLNVPVTFTATSLNLGPSDAQNVSITLTLTPDFRYSAHTAAGATCTTPQVGTTGSIVCTWAGATASGATRTLSVIAYSNAEGTSSVTASTRSDTPDPVSNNDASAVSVLVGTPVTPVPALNAWGLLLLLLSLGLFGTLTLRRPS